MKYNYHIAVIGAGSAGLVVASGARTLGAKVALIERHKLGGDCLNFGCVPSKTFLKSAHIASQIRDANKYGLEASLGNVDISRVMKRVHNVIDEIAPHDSQERFEKLGCDVFREKGILIDAHTVQIGEKTITAKNMVIATGSRPTIPSIPGLHDVSYFTNETIFDMGKIQKTPKNLVILGAGHIGLELGQAFNNLGSSVTMIDMLPSLFPKDEKEVSFLMMRIFEKENISFCLSSKIQEIKKEGDSIVTIIEKDGKQEEIKADSLLVALGRKPATFDIGLEKAGVQLDKKGYVLTDQRLRTSVKNIYACGDVVGQYQFTHMAGYQAGVVIRNIIFKLPAKTNYTAVPWVTYTHPEVAHVGHTEETSRIAGLFHDAVKIDLNEMDRAKAEDDRIGFLKCITDKKGRLIGATIVGEKAGELIAIASMAINNKMKLSSFASYIFSYPTEAEIYKFAAYSFMKKSFLPWKQKLVKKIFIR